MHFAPLDSDVSWPSFNHAPTPGESVYDHWYSGGLRDVDAAELRDRDRGQHGWQLRSTTMIVSDKAGTPVAALCINSDVSPWLAARSLIDGMVAVALGVSRFTIYNYLNELDSTGKRDE